MCFSEKQAFPAILCLKLVRKFGPDVRKVGPDAREVRPGARKVGPGVREVRPSVREAGPGVREAGPDPRGNQSSMPKLRSATPLPAKAASASPFKVSWVKALVFMTVFTTRIGVPPSSITGNLRKSFRSAARAFENSPVLQHWVMRLGRGQSPARDDRTGRSGANICRP